MSIISWQLLEKSTLPGCWGSYWGFSIFFFLWKNNKANLHLGNSDHNGSLLLLPAPSFHFLAQKELRSSSAFFPPRILLFREKQDLTSSFRIPKPQGSCLHCTFQLWKGRKELITPFLSGLYPPLCQMRWKKTTDSPISHCLTMSLVMLAGARKVVTFLPLYQLDYLWSQCHSQHVQPLYLASRFHNGG